MPNRLSAGCCCGCTIFDMRIATTDDIQTVTQSLQKNSFDLQPSFDIANAYFELQPGETWSSKAVMPKDHYFVAIRFPPSGGRYKYQITLDYNYEIEGGTASGVDLIAEVTDGPQLRIKDNSFNPWTASRIDFPFLEYHNTIRLRSDWLDDNYSDGISYTLGAFPPDKSIDIDLRVFDNCVEVAAPGQSSIPTLSNQITEESRLHRPRSEAKRARVRLKNIGTEPMRFRSISAFKIASTPNSQCELVPKTYLSFSQDEPLPVSCELNIYEPEARPRKILGSHTEASSIPWSNFKNETVGDHYPTVVVGNPYESQATVSWTVPAWGNAVVSGLELRKYRDVTFSNFSGHLPISLEMQPFVHKATVTPILKSSNDTLFHVEVSVTAVSSFQDSRGFLHYTSANERPVAAYAFNDPNFRWAIDDEGRVWRIDSGGRGQFLVPTPTITYGPDIPYGIIFRERYEMRVINAGADFECVYGSAAFRNQLNPVSGLYSGEMLLDSNVIQFYTARANLGTSTFSRRIECRIPNHDRGLFPELQFSNSTTVGTQIGTFTAPGGSTTPITALAITDTGSLPIKYLQRATAKQAPLDPNFFTNGLLEMEHAYLSGFTATIKYTPTLKQ